MTSDIVLERIADGMRIVIDTKFTSVFGASPHRAAVLKSPYIYQMYAYLRSQERAEDPQSHTAAGVLLHPTVGEDLNESVKIQGHAFSFVTVDLTLASAEVLGRLRAIITESANIQ